MPVGLMLLPAVFLLSLAATSATNSYLVMAPSSFRAGQLLQIQVNILNAESSVRVRAEITRDENTTISTVTGNFNAGHVDYLSLEIPDVVLEGMHELHISGSGGLTFNEKKYIRSSTKALSVYIQTDKGMYKAGQTVNYRVFGTYPNLKPYLEPIRIFVRDSRDNLIQQLDSEDSNSGVTVGKLELSDQPVLGNWKIRVKAGDQWEEAAFAVGEYVLPKFDVKVDFLRSFITSSDSDVRGTVEAKYTYGKHVTGSVKLVAKIGEYRWRLDKANPTIERTFTMIDRPVDFRFTMEELKSLDQYRVFDDLIVQANVTETLTNTTLGSKSSIAIYRKKLKLEFPTYNSWNFKPGLRYNVQLNLVQQDGTPAPDLPKDVIIARTYSWSEEEEEIAGDIYRTSGTCSYTRVENNMTASADDKGVIDLNLDIPDKVSSMTMHVYYAADEKIRLYQRMSQMNSRSGAYLQVTLLNPTGVKSGARATFEVKSTAEVSAIYYQIMSRGNVRASDRVNIPYGSSSKARFHVEITAEMAPKATIVTHYVTDSGELIIDAMSFNVEGIFENKVSLSLSNGRSKPGEHVGVTLTADEGSYVGLVAIDKSSKLLRRPNEITTDKVKEELNSFNSDYQPYYRGWYWPRPVDGTDADSVLRNAGLIYMTDALVYKTESRSGGAFDGRMAFAGVGASADSMEDGLVVARRGKQDTSSLAEVTRVRKSFPETWLWDSISLEGSNTMTIESQVPDTITSWEASAFALHQRSGLGVLDSPQELEVFQNFFVSLKLPYSIVRGEDAIIQINVFNYMSEPLNVRVTLEASEDFSVLREVPGSYAPNVDVTANILVLGGTSRGVSFPIRPGTLGSIPIKVKAQSPVAADAVERRLLVEPEGVPQEYTKTVLISRTGHETEAFQTVVPITLPPSLIEGSSRVTVNIVGDIMGQSLNNLEGLLKMPSGCGEQNMVNFVPNIFVIKYLELTNQIMESTRAKAVNYLEKGYQRELSYQRRDGSFSAFGERDLQGSMWLTAFVAKSFAQAKPYTFIDADVITKAVDWIIERQAPDGSFPEHGIVLSQSLQGGVSSHYSMTAYVLSALVEVSKLGEFERSIKIRNARRRAVGFLESSKSNFRNPYTMSLSLYALTKHFGSRVQYHDSLLPPAIIDGDTKHWEMPDIGSENEIPEWNRQYKKSKAINVEMTAYNLMTYSLLNDVTEGVPIMKWLTEQRNGRGGYVSTQDTMVALEALSMFAAAAYGENRNVEITITAAPEPPKEYNVQNDNAMVLQSYVVTSAGRREIRVRATGTGTALVQVVVSCHVQEVPEPPAFEIEMQQQARSLNTFTMEVCVKYIKGRGTGMAVVEHGILSGFTLDQSSLDDVPGLKRFEMQDRKVVIYFDSIVDTPLCYTPKLVRSTLVAKTAPAPILVYNYYSPDESATVYYTSEMHEDAEACDICVDCDFSCP